MNTKETTLILGGMGKTGRRVAARLDARGLPVRMASRSSATRFDWSDPSTWDSALHDVKYVYITYPPDLAFPGASDDIRRFVNRAVEHGVRRMVLLSGRGEPQVLPAERAVQESGAAFTILRASFFCQNFDEGQFLEPVLGGEIAFPAGDVAEPFIDAEDIADVAAAALTDDAHAGKIYELTGPRLLTFADVAEEISRASGRAVKYLPVTSEQFGEALATQMPAEVASFLTELFGQLLDGHNAHVTDGVERVLGRAARDFRDYAKEAAASGVWG